MRKSLLKKFLIILIVFSLASIQLTSCTFKYRYMNDRSEINCVEIVEADYNSHRNEPVQHLIYKIDDIQTFLNEFEEIHYTTAFGEPMGIECNTLAIKISYKNGDYEILDQMAKSSYDSDLDRYRIYRSSGSFDLEEFYSLLSKYIECVENAKFNYMHDKSLVSSIEIAKLNADDRNIYETLAVIDDVDDFYASLEKIPYVHTVEYICEFYKETPDNRTVIKINYTNGDYEMFTNCLRESYKKELKCNYTFVYMGKFEETAFNALMQKYIDMNND